jgi:hypothetical protein
MILENPVALAVVGVLAATVALMVFLSRRTTGPLVALAALVGLTLILLVVERLVVTDREAVQHGVEEVVAAIEANDVAGVLAWIDPAAVGVKADVEALTPMIKVSNANAAGVRVDIFSSNPTTAKAEFRAYLQGVHSSSGMSLYYVNQRVDLNWIKRGDRWLIDDYTAYYDEQPINAVGSAQGNRALPR